MKTIILLFIVMLLLQIGASAQSYCFASAPHPARCQTFPALNYNTKQPHYRKICIVTKLGLISLGTGVIMTWAGLTAVDNYQATHSNSTGNGIYYALVGVLLAGDGVCFAIGGGIHDIVNHHRHKMSKYPHEY